MRDLLFAGIFTFLLPLCAISAFVGVLLWTWVALLPPNDYLYSFMIGVPINKIVAIVTLFLLIFSRDKKRPYFDMAQLLLVLLAFAAIASWAYAIVPSDLSDDLFQKLLKEIVLALAITTLMTTRLRLHLLLVTIVVALGFISFKEGMIGLLTAGGHKVDPVPSIGDNNSIATALLMIVPLAVYAAQYSAERVARIGMWCATGLSVVAIVMTFSRGGFIGMMVLGLILVANSRRRVSALLLVAAVAVTIFVLAPESWFERLQTIRDTGNDSSFLGRVVAWKISTLIALDRPLIGGGPHAVQNLLVWQTYKPDIGLFDFIATPPPDATPHAAHSIYFEILGDMGFTGLFLFLAMQAVTLANTRWITRNTRNHPRLAWAADMARMVQISMVLYLITGAALSLGYFELVYILVALVSRLKRLVRDELAAEAKIAVPNWHTDGELELAPAYAATPHWE